MLARAGQGLLVWKVLYAVSVPSGPRHLAPCLRSACAEICLEDAACWPLRVPKKAYMKCFDLFLKMHLV